MNMKEKIKIVKKNIATDINIASQKVLLSQVGEDEAYQKGRRDALKQVLGVLNTLYA